MNYPNDLLVPIKKYLEDKRAELSARKSRLKNEDPFSDLDRINDNAAIDTDAAEQFGHENTLAMRNEVDRKLAEIGRALTRIADGSYGNCTSCGAMIDTDRLRVDPTSEYCVSCQRKKTVVE